MDYLMVFCHIILFVIFVQLSIQIIDLVKTLLWCNGNMQAFEACYPDSTQRVTSSSSGRGSYVILLSPN